MNILHRVSLLIDTFLHKPRDSRLMTRQHVVELLCLLLGRIILEFLDVHLKPISFPHLIHISRPSLALLVILDANRPWNQIQWTLYQSILHRFRVIDFLLLDSISVLQMFAKFLPWFVFPTLRIQWESIDISTGDINIFLSQTFFHH